MEGNTPILRNRGLTIRGQHDQKRRAPVLAQEVCLALHCRAAVGVAASGDLERLGLGWGSEPWKQHQPRFLRLDTQYGCADGFPVGFPLKDKPGKALEKDACGMVEGKQRSTRFFSVGLPHLGGCARDLAFTARESPEASSVLGPPALGFGALGQQVQDPRGTRPPKAKGISLSAPKTSAQFSGMLNCNWLPRSWFGIQTNPSHQRVAADSL